jgi:inosine-uridine nucleoside N-ribohydrolase
MHDSSAVMAVVNPSVFTKAVNVYVDIESVGERTAGMCVPGTYTPDNRQLDTRTTAHAPPHTHHRTRITAHASPHTHHRTRTTAHTALTRSLWGGGTDWKGHFKREPQYHKKTKVVLEVDQAAFKRYYLDCLATFLPKLQHNKEEKEAEEEAAPPSSA